jgi:hypothetical protein
MSDDLRFSRRLRLLRGGQILSCVCLRFLACCLLTLSLLVCPGCETPQAATSPVPQPAAERTQATELLSATVPSGFGPARISILPLSEITGTGQGARLNVYVALIDAFGCPIKAPTTLRIELYEHVRRSAQPKGQRLHIWPDIDLTHPAENHNAWRDFLRAYEFQFDLRAGRDTTYILEVTCLSPEGRRLTAESAIRTGR